MKLADKEVDDAVIAEYVEKVRHMYENSRKMPVGVSLGYADTEREELHEKLLDAVNETRGSAFDKALTKHIEELGRKEGWLITWDDIP